MDILPALVFGFGSAAYVLHLLRLAKQRQAPVEPRIEEVYRQPSTSTKVEPPRHRRPDCAPAVDADHEHTRGPYLVGSSGSGGRRDATALMMDAMAGPGLCTPP